MTMKTTRSVIGRWLDSDVGYSFRTSPTAVVAAIIAIVFLHSAWEIIRDARRELRENA